MFRPLVWDAVRPAHAQFTAREVRYVLQHADVVIVVVDAERLPLVQRSATSARGYVTSW